MALLSSIDRHGIWLAVPSFAAALFLLVRCIAGVVRTVKKARLFSAPLVETQVVEFPEAGRVVLAMEGPLLSRRHGGLRYALDGPDGRSVRGRRLLFRTVTAGSSTSTIQLKVFDVVAPGRHVLRIDGLGGPRRDDARCRVVLMRPHLAASMGYVLGILLASGWAIASLVLFLQRLFGVEWS